MIDKIVTKISEMAAKRQLALYHLRTNPNNVVQTTKKLYREDGSRCALGLIAEAFDIPVDPRNTYAAYDRLKEELGLRITSFIYNANDAGMTYAQVADVMEEAFEKGTWDRVENDL